MATSPGSPNHNSHQQQQLELPPGVRKCGYLRKHKHGHKRFFVLRGPDGGAAGEEEEEREEASPPRPARLEYYESEKKWRNKSTAPKRSIALASCLNIHKRADAKHKHLVALYTRDEYFALEAEDEQEQEAWYQALTELLGESHARNAAAAARHGSPGRPLPLAAREESGHGPLSCGMATGAAAYREVWQVTLKPKGLGQSRNLTGVHRLCLTARTVGLVRLNCERPCVTLQLMNIRRCGHSDSFFFMELGRSASTGPGELWMQADDSVVAQNIHETILEAMKALRELAEFRPRSKSQSSSSSSSSGGAVAIAAPLGGGGGGLSALSSRPISVPSRRCHRHYPPAALPPSQTGVLRRSRTDTLVVAGSQNSRARTASEGDGGRGGGSLAGSPLSPDAGQNLLSRSQTLGAACCRLGGQTGRVQPGRSLVVGHSPSLVSRLTPEAGTLLSQDLSSSSVPSSPGDPGGYMTFEDLGSSLLGDPQPFSFSSAISNQRNTPEAASGPQLDDYTAMDQGQLCYRTSLQEMPGGDKGPRKRTYSLTAPLRQPPLPLPLSSVSLDEYTLMQATLPKPMVSSRATYTPYPEDYCDVDIGSGGTSSSSSSHLGHSGGGEDGYMHMISGIGSLDCFDGYMSMSPASVSAPQQILHPRPYKISSESSPDDSGYVPMWSPGTRLSDESPDHRLSSGDYISMSPLLLPSLHGSSMCASLSPSPDGFSALGSRDLAGCFCSALSHRCQSQLSFLAEKRHSDQYVHMNSPAGRLNCTAEREPILAPCRELPSPTQNSQDESFLCQQSGSSQPNHLSLELLQPSMDVHVLPAEPQSPSGEYVNIDYTLGLACNSSTSSLSCGVDGQNNSLISSYMNLSFHESQSGAVSVGSLDEIVLSGSCPSTGQFNKHYLKVGMEMACLSSPSSAAVDCAEVVLTSVATTPQPISQNSEDVCLTSPMAGLKQLTLAGLEAFIIASPPPDPTHGAKVIRADPQGRRRHSSETFSSTTTVTPVSPSFAHNPKRHNSASVENVSLRKNEGSVEEQNGSPMCRETSAGFQNGLNYIAVGVLDGKFLEGGDQGRRKGWHHPKGNKNGTFTSIDFLAHNLKETCTLKE